MTDITAKLDAIEAGLKGVTPGPWNVEPRNRSKNFSVAFRPELKVCQTFGDSVAAEADAAHIARLDPDTVRELVRLARIGADAPAIRAAALGCGAGQFRIGDRVTKIKGSQWTGRIVGFYSTTLTPEGYAVESETEIGSVQIYPAAAIRALKDTP